MLGEKTFAPQDSLSTLESLGISEGSELTCCRLSVLEVMIGARIVVREAGSDEFNGTYVGMSDETYFQKEGKEGEDQCIVWYSGNESWPAGWYMEKDGWRQTASYFIESNDMTCLPMTNWSSYEGVFSDPGLEPAPVLGSE